MSVFKANCLPLLIGSLPISDHQEATRLILHSTPDIPIWPQLPVHKEEGMILQFLPGFPGRTEKEGKVFINTKNAGFDDGILAFYEEYINVTEGGAGLETSRFTLTPDTAEGFFTFLDQTGRLETPVTALKGQITGPITFCTAIADESGRAIFYNDQLKDAAVKMLALKARWQIRKMTEICGTAIVFLDEPGLAGFGSSAFITIGPEEIKSCLNEVVAAIHAENGLAGIHVCANTEWPVIFDTDVDIVSCDTYSFFDKFLLFPGHLLRFFDKGGILASGIIPTIPEFIDVETVDTLISKWLEQKAQLQDIGIQEDRIFAQTLITPSCGTGSISMEYTLKVLELTQEVSKKIRELR
jgi:methionine synthase II (cobalamin-independent)